MPPRVGTEAANNLPEAASKPRPTYQKRGKDARGNASSIRRDLAVGGLDCCKFCNDWVCRLGGEIALGTAIRIWTDVEPRSPVWPFRCSKFYNILDGKATWPPYLAVGQRAATMKIVFSVFRPPPRPSTGGGGFVLPAHENTASRLGRLLFQVESAISDGVFPTPFLKEFRDATSTLARRCDR